MVVDSNIIIYSVIPFRHDLREWIRINEPVVSAISYVEVYGYPDLTKEEERALDQFFAGAVMLEINQPVLDQAVSLRQQRRMSLGDAIVAATALLHDHELATHNTRDFAWIAGLHVIDPMS